MSDTEPSDFGVGKNIEDFRAIADKIDLKVSAVTDRLSGWLVLGNTGALALLFQFVLSKPPCTAALLPPLMAPFQIGMVAAFGSVTLHQILSWATARLHRRMARKLEKMKLDRKPAVQSQPLTVDQEKLLLAMHPGWKDFRAENERARALAVYVSAARYVAIGLLFGAAIAFAVGVALGAEVIVNGTGACPPQRVETLLPSVIAPALAPPSVETIPLLPETAESVQ